MVLAIMAAVVIEAGCGGNGYHAQGDSGSIIVRAPHEIQAQALLHRTIARAEKLLDHPQVSAREKKRLRQAVAAARDAQSRYNELRKRGRARTQVMSSIAAASLALLADDVTGLGIVDNVALIPLALTAMVTYMVTTAPASSDELARAWTQVGQRTQELADAVNSVLEFAAPGNMADTGIMEEVYQLMASGRSPKGDVCAALAILYEAAKNARNVRKQQRIEGTQKYHGCRHSRHKGRL